MSKQNILQTRKHSSSMRTTRFLTLRDVSLTEPPQTDTPQAETTWTETPWTEPLGHRPPQKEHETRDRDPLRRNMGPVMGPVNQTGSDIIQRPPPL